MIDLLVYHAVLVIVMVLIWWLLSQLPLPEPIGKIVQIILVVIAAVVLVSLLLQLTGHGGIPLRLR
jgi:hypothetical protein